ncbi:MAG: DUF4159 domain-containing protein [Verrucomicrobia bacterium]|nr:DUF4159 domain-containing protein [Verrucomicrobiota bacterium]
MSSPGFDSNGVPGGRLLRRFWPVLALSLLAVGAALAQRFDHWAGGDPHAPEFDTCRTAREAPAHSTETPNWTNSPAFERDVFTFARLRYQRLEHGAWWGAGYWWSDFPDSDLNLSFRLQQATSMKVDPNGRVLNINDKELVDYPWVYMVEPGRLKLTDEEVTILRKYLLNGGFLMADDFWGDNQWANFEGQIKRILPERSFTELPMEHPLFHCVFDLKGPKSSLQTMNVAFSQRARTTGVTWELHDGQECKEMHVRVILDDKGRIMVLATHNCDNGDGWEREGEDDYFFHEFSEKRAYPLAINIIYYVMTH